MHIQLPLKYQAGLTGLVVISFNIPVLRFICLLSIIFLSRIRTWPFLSQSSYSSHSAKLILIPLSSHATSSLMCLAVSAKFQVTDQATPSVSLEHGFAGLMDSALLTVLSTHQRRVCALWAFLWASFMEVTEAALTSLVCLLNHNNKWKQLFLEF